MDDPPPPADRLVLRAAAPLWFQRAIACAKEEHVVNVADCPIHYLLWPAQPQTACGRDLSGMGDSGRRASYGSDLRAQEMRAVIADAALGARPFVIGHSFGGFMTMKFAAAFGEELGGAVIVDSPIRAPEEEAQSPLAPPKWANKKIYPTFEAALARFRLMPPQTCENEFIVEYIARHSLMPADGGWTWKFDGAAMGARRFGEPFREYLQAARCRAALLFGENSALVSRHTASYMSSLMGSEAPIVEMPEAQHHVMLDQPLAFVAALRMLLQSWVRAEPP